MTTRTTLDTFEDSLAERKANCTRTRVDGFAEALADLLVAPAVGTPLPFEGVSYGDLPVTVDPSPTELERAESGVTAASLGIADYGTVVLASGSENTEGASLFPGSHVVVVAASDVLSDMPAAFERLQGAFEEGLTSAVLATGPSSTADMGALVYGAHGPRAVHVVILADR